ncbi:hypothetical protein DRF67_04485 [Chryseobacterium pennipullorum]|uniref:Uncharacterized protein n=1 Tax=Chryseobacterium pennipullorum TaxID=2258963 RepID=A0A3D9B7R3_9FLAO|nr:hypothetical protein DRF67_04485 [Chryseobacterium pennipullorum]
MIIIDWLQNWFEKQCDGSWEHDYKLSYKKDAKILKLAQETFRGNDLLRKEANTLIGQLKSGNINPGIGTKNIGKNAFEARLEEVQEFTLEIAQMM